MQSTLLVPEIVDHLMPGSNKKVTHTKTLSMCDRF